MKVILLQDIARIGKRFEVQDVPTGHALNYLIPRGMAKPATSENLKNITEQKRKSAAETAKADETRAQTFEKLAGTTVEMQVPANEQGHLFKGIKAEDIAAEVSNTIGALAAENIVLDAPIKEVGEHTISLRRGEEEVHFTLNITAK